MDDQEQRRKNIIERIRWLAQEKSGGEELHEAVALAQALLYETLGPRHPLMTTLNSCIDRIDWTKVVGACRTLITLYEQGDLVNPRFQVAKELEEDLVDVAEQQWKHAENENDLALKRLRLAVAAFLCGSALEDALRRLCDKHNQPYESDNTSLAKLQASLYSPSKSIEIISKSENAQIGAWGQTRNNADHGHFDKIGAAEVSAMVIGVRGFIGKHLP